MSVSIRTYFAFALAFTVVASAAVSTQLFNVTSEMVEIAEKLHRDNANVFIAQNLRQHLTTFRRQALLTDIKSRAERQATLYGSENSLIEEMNLMSQSSVTATDKMHFDKISINLKKYLNDWGEARKKRLKGERLYLVTSTAYEDTIEAIHELLNFNYEAAETTREAAHSLSLKYRENLKIYWLAFFVAITLLFLSFYYVIYRPLHEFHLSIRNFGNIDAHSSPSKTFIHEIHQIRLEFSAMKKRLERQNKQRLGFLAAVAHDLKNPLAALQMSLELLIQQSINSENAAITGIIRRQFKQLTRLINDLLDTSRIEMGELRLERIEFDLSELVKECISLFESSSKIHSFNVFIEAAEGSVFADRDRIAQVLNNLLSNAIKYSPSGGPIDVVVRVENKTAFVSVSDKGVGIEPEDLDSIFEPFQRSKSAHHNLPGVGLGLSTARKILHGHKGELSVKSTLGQGTTFTFTLPIR